MGPTTSYWPPTISLLRSLGSKSNRCRHWLQIPAIRPCGASGRGRPTGAPQFEQKRLSSGMVASLSTTALGSTTGAGATSTKPAPIPVRRLVVREVAVVRRVDPERADVETALGALAAGVAFFCAPFLACPWAGACWRAAGALAPHVSQYPSGAIVPVQPGCVQWRLMPVAPPARRSRR